MMRASLNGRVDRLEQVASSGELPLYIRQWLGHVLTPAEAARADEEWTKVQALPPPDPSAFSPEQRGWLANRGEPA